jgi:uncharacterized LabA/DUF88 family protein
MRLEILVTTQNTEPENSDVNETVVEQLPASETPAAPAEAEGAIPALEQPISTQTSEEQAAEEVIHSFTDFIEEFRKTEPQFGSLLEETQEEPFSSLIAGEEQDGSQFIANWSNTPIGESTLLEGTAFAVEDIDGYDSTQTVTRMESNGNVVEKPSEATVVPESQPVSTQEQQTPSTSSENEAEAATSTEHPASPLLRHAPRIRLPRHGGSRQREVSAGEEKVQQEPVAEAAPSAPPSGEEGQAGVTSIETTEPAPVETSSVEEQPRRERRYRFDRRMPTASAPAGSTQARTEENKVSPVPSQPLPRIENGQVGEREEQPAQQPKQSTSVAQPTEQPTPKQAVAQESVATQEAEAVKETVKPAQDGRGRHGQERQREKAKATPTELTPTEPVAEVATPGVETSKPQAPEVALEDLPPLEYSELRAASSRRRRRRRSGSTNPTAAALNNNTPAAAKSATQDVPGAGSQTPSSPSPVSPGPVPQPAPSAGQYSLLSGYTLNQMNHGNDDSGPFMGPEPSPARGSTMSRTIRPIRNEAQRMPSAPIRHNEASPSAASVNHLASAVVQAIQSQTDRMVAELRHTNQVPTNVSVSLPSIPSTERVGVFVDVANLLYSARTQRLTIDFGKLLDFLRGNRRLVRAHAYCPTSPQASDDQMFLQAVKGLGYRITTKNYKTFSSGAKKADLDLDLCMDVVRLVDGRAVDCIVLVSGDSDFMPMLDYCSDHGVRVEVAAFDESMSASLRQSCDLFINLSMLEEIRA